MDGWMDFFLGVGGAELTLNISTAPERNSTVHLTLPNNELKLFTL